MCLKTSLEDKNENGVHLVDHEYEYISANEEKSTIKFYAGSKKFRIVGLV